MTKKILVLIVAFAGFMHLQFATFALADETQISRDSEQIPIKGIISNPVYYDGKNITVEGQVEKIHYTTSSGEPYTLLRLHDGEHNSIGVYSKGHLTISGGAKVRVTGTFKKEKGNWIFKFKNVLKAKQVEEMG
jgi:hypothetical protein